MVFESVSRLFAPKKAADTTDVLKSGLRRQLADLRADLTDVNVGEKSTEFFSLVHVSFSKLMDLPASTTYTELKSVIKESSRLDADYKKSLASFLNEVEHLEYDFPEFVNDREMELAKEKDVALHYLKHLMEHADNATRRKLVELDKLILSDRPVSAKRIIDNYLSRFEELVDAFRV